jgi:hypothetical protein
MTNITSIVDAYIGMWNVPTRDERARHIAKAWAEDGAYADPMFQASGHDGLNDMVAGVQGQFPGHRFRRASGIDAHHNQARFAWELTTPEGSIAAAGIDIAELAPDGRLRRVTGFFGDLPAETAAVGATTA